MTSRQVKAVGATFTETALRAWVPCPCQVAGSPRGRRSAGTAAAAGGRCLAAELGMTEQPVCPCCLSGCTWWGRGVQHALCGPGCSPPGIHLPRLCCSEAANPY